MDVSDFTSLVTPLVVLVGRGNAHHQVIRLPVCHQSHNIHCYGIALPLATDYNFKRPKIIGGDEDHGFHFTLNSIVLYKCNIAVW